ncbi:hypothetical protein CAEBREN_20925 [Caenorhabditis brenneri]|uniref:Uncharacterized protein n=1 Tax=Caenorhabditis brenneri TaxID=135651 RepID=G0MJ77_CAEBE|nr:hypothetical protein CAEBREN_20925 [Caenorhabditis brenneri]
MTTYNSTSYLSNNNNDTEIDTRDVDNESYANYIHGVFTIVMLVLYVKKIIEKKRSQFRNFRSFHILMYITLIGSLAAKFIFIMKVFIVFHSEFVFTILVCQLISILIIFRSTKLYKLFCLLIINMLFILRIICAKHRITVTIFEGRSQNIDTFEWGALGFILILCGFIVCTVNIKNQKTLPIVINSGVVVVYFMTISILPLFNAYFYEHFKNHEDPILHTYYLSVLWIISVYIFYSERVQKWMHHGTYKTSDVPLSQVGVAREEPERKNGGTFTAIGETKF